MHVSVYNFGIHESSMNMLISRAEPKLCNGVNSLQFISYHEYNPKCDNEVFRSSVFQVELL